MKLIVYRSDPSEVDKLDIDLTKKSGKNLGLGFYVGNPKGIYITDIVSIILCSHGFIIEFMTVWESFNVVKMSVSEFHFSGGGKVT